MKLFITTLTMVFISFGVNSETIWKSHIMKDEMSGEKTFYTFNDKVKSTRSMSFPYNKTNSFIALMCKKNRITFSFLFNVAPNISNAEIITKNFNNIKTRIKFGEKITDVELLQKWGGKQVSLRNYEQYLPDLKNSDELLLELDWHGEGKVYFKFPTKGFSIALEDLKNKCAS